MKALHIVTLALLAVGGLNWGLVGLFNFDLVAAILGEGSLLSRLVYVVVGICAVYQATTLVRPNPAAAHSH
jgi:uncharacterized protein